MVQKLKEADELDRKKFTKWMSGIHCGEAGSAGSTLPACERARNLQGQLACGGALSCGSAREDVFM